tara:strand:+ start:166 stop:432 length:267 start_codon:yes stop_codon:yes gene_type:complete
MAKARIRNIIRKYLNTRSNATTHEIYDHVNQATKHGVTMSGLSNLLSKDKTIQKEGLSTAHTVASRYQGTIWSLRQRSLDEESKMDEN